jgi:hypothetical protein
MKTRNAVLLIPVLLLVGVVTLAAADFGWIDDFDLTVQADPSGFRARLAARFRVGDAQVNAVIGDCSRPADAYLVFRCAELAGRPVDRVLEEYRAGKGKGWGVIARRLGIKPGSAEFKALKRGDDLYTAAERRKVKDKATDHERERDSGKDRDGAPEPDRGPGHAKGRGSH